MALESRSMRVLVIDVRGWNFTYVGCHGNEWIQTPTLDRLAAEGVVFDQHYADRPDAEGACRSWRSGCYSLPAIEECALSPDPASDLIQRLRNERIVAWLVRDASRPSPAEFASGWDRVSEGFASDPEVSALEATLETWQTALTELAETDSWLLWLELATLLPPWEVPPSYLKPYLVEPVDEEEEEESEELEPWLDPPLGLLDPADPLAFVRLQRSYAGAVSYLDAGLALVLQELEEKNLLDEVLLVVTSGHGFPLGEHGQIGLDRPWLHEELIHVPLLLRFPGKAEAGRRVSALTQSLDLPLTLLDYFGLPSPSAHGHSLVPLVQRKVAQVRDFACSGLRLGQTVEWAMRSPEWAFVLPVQGEPVDSVRTAQLYVKPDDRWEVNNVVHHHPQLAEHLEQTLRGFVAASQQPGPLQPPTLRDVETESET